MFERNMLTPSSRLKSSSWTKCLGYVGRQFLGPNERWGGGGKEYCIYPNIRHLHPSKQHSVLRKISVQTVFNLHNHNVTPDFSDSGFQRNSHRIFKQICKLVPYMGQHKWWTMWQKQAFLRAGSPIILTKRHHTIRSWFQTLTVSRIFCFGFETGMNNPIHGQRRWDPQWFPERRW